MESDHDVAILTTVANGGSMDYGLWPEMMPRVRRRLEQIAHHEFALQRPFPSSTSSSSHSSQLPSQLPSQPEPLIRSQNTDRITVCAQSTGKENSIPQTASTSNSSTSAAPDAQTLPPRIQALLDSILDNLNTYFTIYPPHTIQRLSELVLSPRQHYRTLSSYLHAVDRVVHVTSGANIYPLPAAVPDDAGTKILANGVTSGGADPSSVSWGASTTAQASLGSDESLGGALLTPIPWLRHMGISTNGNGQSRDMDGEVKTESTETIDGPNGAGSIETVSVSVNGVSSVLASSTGSAGDTTISNLRAEGGVTQGELLRQEQRAGVVPATQLVGNRGSGDGNGEDDESPHARGPDEIGMEDMGPQTSGNVGNGMHAMQGIDVEAAVGRRAEGHEERREASPASKRESEEDIRGENKRTKEDTEKPAETENENEDMELVDADGKREDEPKVGEKGENEGPDASDASTI